MERCLICSKKKVKNATHRCKLCGMGVNEKDGVKEGGFVFCCENCSKRFKIILEHADEKEKEDMLRKDIMM